MNKLFKISYFLIVLYSVFAVSPLVGDVDRPSLGGITDDHSTASLRILAVERVLAAFIDSVVPDDSAQSTDDDSFMVKKLRARPKGNDLFMIMSSASHLTSDGSAVMPEASPLLIQTPSHHTIGSTIIKPVAGYGTHFSGLAPPSLLS